MSHEVTPALSYGRLHRSEFLSELKDFLRFPSVSSQPERTQDVKRCAHWLARHLQSIGLEQIQIVPTRGYLIVFGSWLHAPAKPTVLIYGHYDVLPGEPRRQWRTPPFASTIKGPDLYARGAADDKGQLFCHVKAIESYLRTTRALPVNMKCIFEGEEEIGSTHLLRLIERNRTALCADAAVISDSKMLGPGRPAVGYSQRGGLRAELVIRGPKQELHSGTFGGAVLDPIQAACEIIAGLYDRRGRISIPGVYDDVRLWSNDERAYMARTGPSDDEILHEAHVAHECGESGYTLYERTTIRPALTINGISGGYSGPGVKGVIPPSVVVKLSFRLVPNQAPQRIEKLFREHIARIAPPGVQVVVRTFSPVQPALMDRKHPAVRAATLALKKGFGASPVFLRSGGSIPVVNAFKESLGIPTVLMGFGLPDDSIHAANEKFHLPNFYRGIETSIWYLAIAARILLRNKPSEQQTKHSNEFVAY
jgi:acetylornithine deacetylase/succinyl-diaminopimelate desuccinylase-like protein